MTLPDRGAWLSEAMSVYDEAEKVPALEAQHAADTDLIALLRARVAELENTPLPVDPPPVDPPPVDPPPVDPPPVDPVPSGLAWWQYPANPPAGARTFTGNGSLKGFLTSLKAGEVGVLDTSATFRENLVGLVLADGVTVLPAPGAKPWVDGPFQFKGGRGVTLYGLSYRWTGADPGGHMVKLDAGSALKFGHGEVTGAGGGCYTLVRPGQTLVDFEVHHLDVHDNPGVSSHDGNQDHGFYVDTDAADAKGRMHHLYVHGMPRGRNIKVGGPSAGATFGGLSFDRCTLVYGRGPSNFQVSNGASTTHLTNSVLIDSGASTATTVGSGAGSGNDVAGCWADKTVVPSGNTHLRDAGGNTVKTRAALLDFAANGQAGKGHLA